MNDYMNLAMSLENPRQSGKTTAICNAAKEIGAQVVCANMAQARIVKIEHKVETCSLSTTDKLRGTQLPVLIDHYAVSQVIFDLNREIETLRRQCTLKAQIIEKIRSLLP